MEIAVVAVGKLRPYYREAFDDYARRLQRYGTFREHEVREASRAPTVAAQRAEEAERLRARITEGSNVVALARVGAGWTSADLAKQLERWLLAARPLTFVIGGSHGLDSSLISRAAATWSLGPSPSRTSWPGSWSVSSSIGRSRFCGGSRTIRGRER